MKRINIYNLLDAFYEGKTTPEEENALYHYFNDNAVPDELSAEKDFFLQLYAKNTVKTPIHLSEKMNRLIDELERKEKTKRSKVNRRRIIIGIAAAIALLLMIFVFVPDSEKADLVTKTKNDTTPELTETDAKKIKEAEDALLLISVKFNKGFGQLNLVSSNLQKTNDIVTKTFTNKNGRINK